MATPSSRWSRFGLALFVGLATSSFALDAHADGQRDLQDAIRFYDNLDLERALELFGRATQADDLSEGERALAYIYVGLANFELAKPADAEAAWRRAFELAPGAELPSGVSPKTQEAAEKVRATMPAPGAAPREPPPPSPVDPPEPTPVDPPEPTPVDPPEPTPVNPPEPAPQEPPVITQPPPSVTPPPVEPPSVAVTPGPEPEDEGSSVWLWVGIGAGAAAVAGGIVAAVLLSSSSSDCPVGGCLSVTVQ